jgi:hypothetical protein
MRPKSPNQAAPAKPAGEPRFHSQPVERGLAEPRRSPSYLMRTLVFLLQIVAGCWAGSAQPTNTPLTFYVVSGKQMTGGRFIDTTNYPKLGYIAAKPDLVVKSLAGVYRAKVADHITHIDDKG